MDLADLLEEYEYESKGAASKGKGKTKKKSVKKTSSKKKSTSAKTKAPAKKSSAKKASAKKSGKVSKKKLKKLKKKMKAKALSKAAKKSLVFNGAKAKTKSGLKKMYKRCNFESYIPNKKQMAHTYHYKFQTRSNPKFKDLQAKAKSFFKGDDEEEYDEEIEDVIDELIKLYEMKLEMLLGGDMEPNDSESSDDSDDSSDS